MATFKTIVLEHQKRVIDGKYSVSIRVGWQKQTAYIKTGLYASEEQVKHKVFYNEAHKRKKSLTLTDTGIIEDCALRIKGYEKAKITLGQKIFSMSARELADYFVREGSGDGINFIDYGRSHCKRLIREGRQSTADRMNRTLNALTDYYRSDNLKIGEVTSDFLRGFDDFLRTKRTITRLNQFRRPVTVKKKPLQDVSVHGYMTDVRTIFRACTNDYNDEERDIIRIRHNPFRKYKMPAVPYPEKRVLTLDQLQKVRDAKVKGLRPAMARDIFMLSFYLAGINLVDLYNLSSYKGGRISYKRQKVKRRRKDEGYISLKVFPQAEDIIYKYRSRKSRHYVLRFAETYATPKNFNHAMQIGLKAVSIAVGFRVTSYHARFTFSSLAFNKCGISKDIIDLALNHIDQKLKMAEKYIDRDFSKTDEALEKVIILSSSSSQSSLQEG